MKKRTFRQRLSYRTDRIMSGGPIAMSLLLFGITAGAVLLIGAAASLVSEGSFIAQLWASLMHTLDAGTLAGDATDNVPYIILMSLATLCGMFLTSILIGIIAAGVESKLSELRRGSSVVQEDGHTVIIGFDNDIYTLLRELIEANTNRKDPCIVILGLQSKEEMEDELASHLPDTGNTRIICRSGGLHETYALERCSVDSCSSVIINVQDDAETVKILLALASYMRDKEPLFPELHFVASLQEGDNLEAARIAGEGRAEIIYARDAIARIISSTCRQHGLAQVLTELFDFSGNEFYFEPVPQLAGKSFREAALSFPNAVAAGYCLGDELHLNPPAEAVMEEGARIILLESDDGAYELHEARQPDESAISSGERPTDIREGLIVLGSNDKLPIILREYDKYVRPGTAVVIADDDFDPARLGSFDNIRVSVCTRPVTRALLLELLEQGSDNLLLLNDDSLEPEASDSQTLLRLILLRDIADKIGRPLAITTEMRSVDNQRLASQVRVDDFVIGSNFAALLMAQISEDPRMSPLICDLLDESGSELYMKPASRYVKPGVPVNSYTLTESALRRGEIFLGYRSGSREERKLVINPAKDELVCFTEEDQLIVIAES